MEKRTWGRDGEPNLREDHPQKEDDAGREAVPADEIGMIEECIDDRAGGRLTDGVAVEMMEVEGGRSEDGMHFTAESRPLMRAADWAPFDKWCSEEEGSSEYEYSLEPRGGIVDMPSEYIGRWWR